MRSTCRFMAVAAIVWLAPLSGRADADASIDLPSACSWGAAGALTCAQPDGGKAAAAISGLTADSVGQARAGDAAATRNIARFYMFGPAAQRNVAQAVSLFEAAAGKGDVRAMLTLATIYRDGELVPSDHARSAAWYRKAADAGSPEGMYYLGGAYAEAVGVPQDHAEALKWYRAAADKGDGPAMAAIGVMFFAGKGEPQDYGKAAEWFSKAAAAGSPEGLQDLAFLYEKGLGVKQDAVRAQSLRVEFHTAYGMTNLATEQEMQSSFPVQAAVAGVEGRAVYSCRAGADHTPEDCFVRSETPAGLGFGEAGFTLIPRMRVAQAVQVGTEFNLPIRFALPPGVLANQAKAERCAAEGLALRRTRSLAVMADWYARYWLALVRYQSQQAGGADIAGGRMDAAVDAAAQRISQGKDGGLFGPIYQCNLS